MAKTPPYLPEGVHAHITAHTVRNSAVTGVFAITDAVQPARHRRSDRDNHRDHRKNHLPPISPLKQLASTPTPNRMNPKSTDPTSQENTAETLAFAEAKVWATAQACIAVDRAGWEAEMAAVLREVSAACDCWLQTPAAQGYASNRGSRTAA